MGTHDHAHNHGAHLEDPGAWPNPSLPYRYTNLLFTGALVLTVFHTVWFTRGVQRFGDLSPCGIIAIATNISTLLYFAASNAALVGVGVNTESCNTVVRFMAIAHFLLKGVVGAYFIEKLHELELLKTARNKRYLVGGLGAGYICIFSMYCIYLDTHIIEPGSTSSTGDFVITDRFCIIELSHTTLILPFMLTFFLLASLTFTSLFRLNRLHSICALLIGVVPIATAIHFLTRGGIEIAAVVIALNSADVIVAFVAVWVVEGSWDIGRCDLCECEVPKLDLEKIAAKEAKLKKCPGMKSRLDRMARVRGLHEMMRKEEEEEEAGESLMGGQDYDDDNDDLDGQLQRMERGKKKALARGESEDGMELASLTGRARFN